MYPQVCTLVLAVERHARLRDLVEARRVVSTDELARLLDVSAETVRRDLIQLGEQGLLRRVHGGAAARSGYLGAEAAFEDRTRSASAAKTAIGAVAAGLVSPGQTLVFDVGTTALEAARALPESFSGTVATCSLLVAAELSGRPGVDVLVSGGRVRQGDLAVSNAQTVSFFSALRPDIAFLGSGGVHAEAGLTDFHVDEVATRRVILANAARSYVLAEAGKIGRVAPHEVCRLDEPTAIITDRPPPEGFVRAAARVGLEIHTPEGDSEMRR